MTKTEVQEDLLEELRNLDKKPGVNPPDPEVYNKAIANGVSPERATQLAYAAANPAADVANDEQKPKKSRKLSDEQLRAGKEFLKRSFTGAVWGAIAGLVLAFVLLIVVRMNHNEVANEEIRFVVILVAGALIGAALGYASAAKHLMSRKKEHHTTPEHKTA